MFVNKGKLFFNRLGIDKAIALTILSRLVQAVGGVGSIFFITKYLTPNEQGYYYTFASILAIQIFFELGLSGIITQYTAHEFARLELDEESKLSGDAYYQSRLSSLLHFCVKWFAIISLILFGTLTFAGFYFFSKFNQHADVNWQTPWIILCLSTSLNLFIDPLLAFFDGLGKVKDMAQMRLIQKSFNVILLIVFFVLGFKLYSSALASLAAILINYVQILFSNRFNIIKSIWAAKKEWVINYYTEIFPFQWRIALSWISGYFIFQLFNPVLFATEGPVVAGQMGMTLQALNGISALSMSWITTKVPIMSDYIAKKEYKQLDTLFSKNVKSLMFVNGTLLSLFIIGIWFLKFENLKYAHRFLPLLPTILLSISGFAGQLIFAFATYLRCHKKEPLLIQSIAMGILVCVSTVFLGKILGLTGITSGYFLLTSVVSLPWTIYIFITKRKAWHNE